MNTFLDFITGGFFNYLGAIFRLPFSKEKYNALVKENLSNNIGMLGTSIIMLIIYCYIKFN